MTVPFLDLRRLHQSIRPELDMAIDRVLADSSFIGGAEVATFEAAFGAAHGTGPGVGCGSGTDALSLSLRAFGVGPGDEVVVPSMTFVATAEAVHHVGARPVVADVDPTTLLLDEESVQRVRTPATRAIIPVHLYGHTVPFDRLQRWADSGLIVVEDAAQAHLATEGGRFVGSVGHVACFSFYPGKNLGALGDGGMVISRWPDVIAEVALLRDHGRTTKYEHTKVGWCSRLDGLQAAVLATKLAHLPEWTEGRRRVAAAYLDLLPRGSLVPWSDGAVHHLMVANLTDRAGAAERLARAGIGSGIHYPVPLSRQPWLVEAGAPAAPASEQASERILSLPMDPLMTESEVEVVCEHLVGAGIS